MAIEVMLVGGTQLHRDVFRVYVNHHPDLWFVGDAPRPRDAVALLGGSRADVLLVDTAGAEEEAFAVVAEISATNPKLHVLCLGDSGEEPAQRATTAGARRFVARDERAENLLNAIRALGNGSGVIPTIEAPVPAGGEPMAVDAAEAGVSIDVLTRRELEVFRLLARGDENSKIATSLDISIRTVETHRARILNKLHARNLGDLVRFAARRGLL